MLLGMDEVEDGFLRVNEEEDRLLGLGEEGYSLLGGDEIEDRLLRLDNAGRLLGVVDKLFLVDEAENRVQAMEGVGVYKHNVRLLGVGEEEVCVAITAVSV